MNKTINIGEGNNSVKIVQTIVESEPDSISVGGVSLTTGYGWGIDISIILFVLFLLYVGKKLLDKHIK